MCLKKFTAKCLKDSLSFTLFFFLPSKVEVLDNTLNIYSLSSMDIHLHFPLLSITFLRNQIHLCTFTHAVGHNSVRKFVSNRNFIPISYLFLLRTFTINCITLLTNELFPGQCAIEWPPPSPDLSPLDFFLWRNTEQIL